jgi:peptidoglycan/xylan/chitin deacetylase (PgdA/CDA1 family)
MKKTVKYIIVSIFIFSFVFSMQTGSLSAATKSQANEFVTRLYKIVLEREPDTAGLEANVMKILAKKTTGAQLVSDFFFSSEFMAKNKDNEEFVTLLFRACFNREPDSAGFDNWTSMLDKGYSRNFVLVNFVNSGEFKNLCAGYGIKQGYIDPGSAPQITTASHIPIIGLHGIENEPSGRYEISAGAFDYLCGTLKQMGYETITLTDLYNHYAKGTKLPAKPVIITSDDGYQDMYSVAFPILKKYKYKMTVFLISSYIGDSESSRRYNDFDLGTKGIPSRPMLIWPEIVKMSKYGCEFQSHTWSHNIISNVSLDSAMHELIQSKSDIEIHTGKPVIFVAWPHSATSDEVIRILPQAGYVGGLYWGGGVQSLLSIDLSRLNRVPIVSEIPPQAYTEVLMLQ